MALHQYDYIFALGTIFAGLDAWNIGANDVANSWATSVGSRSVSYIQAMLLASSMEFAGSLGVGARVADTIRTKIVNTAIYSSDPALLMLGMLCAVTASSLYLTLATRIGLPVSTTHSIIGGVIGMGIASVGAGGIQWVGPNDGTARISSGVVQVFMAWVISPGLAGIFGATIFLITKYGVMLRKNPVYRALFLVPVYFGVTASLLCMLLLWKGGNYTIKLTDKEVAGTIVGVGAAWGLAIAVFLVPWLYRVVIRDDWQVRWYHLPLGLFLLRHGEVPPPPKGKKGRVVNFYEGHLTRQELDAQRALATRNPPTDDVEAVARDNAAVDTPATKERAGDSDPMSKASSETDLQATAEAAQRKYRSPVAKSLVGRQPQGRWYSGPVLFWCLKWTIFRGVDQDVASAQSEASDKNKLFSRLLGGSVENMQDIHARTEHYDNRAEYMYSFLQVMTACTASFTHGANDIANAVGPYATIYQIWNEGKLPAKDKATVENWVLAYCGAMLVIGLWTYGYHIMRNLGNRLTLHSPSRGFSMELGSAITIIIATRLKLPVSTTQCITGATVGVGLCSGTWRSINWRMVGWIYMGWMITLPITGIISGCLMGIIINAPRWGYQG